MSDQAAMTPLYDKAAMSLSLGINPDVMFYDYFHADDGPATDYGWSLGDIFSQQLKITPTLGSELITSNADFSVWASDNPTGWLVQGESGSDPMVNEVGTGQLHGGAGTGRANLYSSATANEPRLVRNTIMTIGNWYRLGVTIDTVGLGAVQAGPAGAQEVVLSTPGTHVMTRQTEHIALRIRGGATPPTDVTLTSATVKEITLSTCFATQPTIYPLRVVEAGIIRGTHLAAGVAIYTDINNFLLAHLDGSGNVVLKKRVAGTYTTLGTAAITYGAGHKLRLVYDPVNETGSVLYNGVTAIPSLSIIDAVFQTGAYGAAFSTHEDNRIDSFHMSAVVEP